VYIGMDGNILPAITGRHQADRIWVLVTGNRVEETANSTKIRQLNWRAKAKAIVTALMDWNKLSDFIVAMGVYLRVDRNFWNWGDSCAPYIFKRMCVSFCGCVFCNFFL